MGVHIPRFIGGEETYSAIIGWPVSFFPNDYRANPGEGRVHPIYAEITSVMLKFEDGAGTPVDPVDDVFLVIRRGIGTATESFKHVALTKVANHEYSALDLHPLVVDTPRTPGLGGGFVGIECANSGHAAAMKWVIGLNVVVTRP